MHAEYHARSSAKKFGGVPENYLFIHNFLDQTKLWLPDKRHRLILHNTFGINLIEKQWRGPEIEGVLVPARLIAEQHIIEDLGRIPTLETCLKDIPFYNWLGGRITKDLVIRIDDTINEFSKK